MFVRIVSLRVRPKLRDSFLSAARANAEAAVSQEPGCLRFDICESMNNPGHFTFYELYRDQAASEVHRQTAHACSWRAAAASLLLAEGGQESWEGSSVWSSGDFDSTAVPLSEKGSLARYEIALPTVVRQERITGLDRGAGVRTFPYVGPWNAAASQLTTGVTSFPPGTGLPLHTHNVEEQVLILEGEADVQLGDQRLALQAGDATWAPAGVPHFFASRKDEPLRIFWVYGGASVTRTICATGQTVAHLSDDDHIGVGVKPAFEVRE